MGRGGLNSGEALLFHLCVVEFVEKTHERRITMRLLAVFTFILLFAVGCLPEHSQARKFLTDKLNIGEIVHEAPVGVYSIFLVCNKSEDNTVRLVLIHRSESGLILLSTDKVLSLQCQLGNSEKIS